ncbi:hypothetical protein RJ640_022997 [Escallonia rubra]|uniref:DUF4005 domain-containing protein n=1 Tax=Escallonia rubra TaxID=112253 RepID=A0AA88RGJ9_9ASTE|nr:hypothetical protein RJ640_022997 [Escallonia rubra]
MGKASRWFRSLFGGKRSLESSADRDSRRGPLRSFNGNGGVGGASKYEESVDANKHAIAVAAATAAVAEAALAAAQAAAEVVRLTSGGGGGGSRGYAGSGRDRRVDSAAVKIQSAFRAYLARRALRALKGLVKLQALVRGHIVRKQSADMLRRMQAMARIQAHASAHRAYTSDSPHSSSKSSQSHHPRCGSKSSIKDNVGLERAQLGSSWFDRWMEENAWKSHRNTTLHGHGDDEKSDKILEIDTWKPRRNPKQSGRAARISQPVSAWNHPEQSFKPFESLSRHTTKSNTPNSGLSKGKVLSLRSLKFPQHVDQAATWTADDSPRANSVSSRPGSSRKGPLTPARSEYAQSFFGDYLSHPNYMANTESSRAKFRSQSAPRQRMQIEKSGSTNRLVRGLWDADINSERGSSFQADFSTTAYPGSGCLERPGTPVQGDSTGYSSNYGRRCYRLG